MSAPPLRPVRSISVLMPTWQGEAFLERSLERLAAQEVELPWDFQAIDSGSTDATLAILARFEEAFPVPFRVRSIHPSAFNHGDTRNELAARSAGELLVFLTQDAIPGGPSWLATLARNFEDPLVAAAYCRNAPRPDADRLTRVFSAGDPGYALERREERIEDFEAYAALDPHTKRLLYNFNDVASAVRRELWERHPFPRTSFGEDLLLSRALLEAGYTVVYDAEAVVEHSHDYDAAETTARARIDGAFNIEYLDRVCIASRSDAESLTKRIVVEDEEALQAEGVEGEELSREVERARALRRAAFLGLWEGGRSRRRRPPTALLSGRPLRLLYVVHGFPPDTWAGTEVYTLNLARGLQALGHEVSVLTRVPAALSEEEGGAPEFELSRSEFEGLPVWRMVHRIDHQSLRESYAHPRAEEVFRQVLARESPDLVHFQHLLHFSANLVPIAKTAGLPTVVTLNDYWALCARVQLIRPDGVRCEENQGLGCLVCLKNKDPKLILPMREHGALAAPLVAGLRSLSKLPKMPSVKLERIVHKRRRKLARWVAAWDEVRERQGVTEGGVAQADLVVAPSRFLREQHLKTGRFDPERLIYSDYGMQDHLSGATREPDPEGVVRFGFVGSLVWYKGCEVMIEAMDHLVSRGVGKAAVLNVFGDYRPEVEPYHRELAAKAGDNVRFRGRFDNQRLAEVYREIDALIVPSIWFENSPITIHEAFLAKTPVVTSDIGGMAELVRHERDGLHFKAGDARDLARQLARLVEEPGLVEGLGQDPPEVKSVEENAREMEYRYRSLVSVRRGGRPA